MALNGRFRHDKGGIRRYTGCQLCGADYENLEHFLLKCVKLEGDRNREMLRRMGGADDEETLGNLLFRGGDVGLVGEMILGMWKTRKYLINRLDTLGGSSLPLRASGTVEIR